MKIITTLFILFLFATAFAQEKTDSVRIHFLYGSKPAPGYKKTEQKVFGGKRGGHVTIEVRGVNFGLNPSDRLHIFSHKKHKHGVYDAEPIKSWLRDTAGKKYTTVTIPVTKKQLSVITDTVISYTRRTPYDYAFLGMRCASSLYDVISIGGIVKRHSRCWMVYRIFYVKPLRRRIFKMAEKQGWKVVRQPGKVSRKWEKG
ncbi:MAG: hypothetical protein V2A54_05500 [Bacteroidota bacterium]